MPTIHANDIDLYYEEHGDSDAEPVFLIMGFNMNSGAWGPQVEALKPNYRVIIFDNRGAGRSSQPAEVYTIPQMAADAAAVLDAIGVESAHIVGMSMGGMIAQEFALRYPARVRSLALLCTTPGGPHSFGQRDIVDASGTLDAVDEIAELATPERLKEYALKLFTPEFLKDPGPGFAALVVTTMAHPSTLDGLRGQAAAILAHDAYDRLPQIKAPTLVMAGSDDTFVDARNAPLLADRIPGARLVMLEGQRHGFNAEKPEETNAALLAFLHERRAA